MENIRRYREHADLEDSKVVASVLFADIEGSSKLWVSNPADMFRSVDTLHDRTERCAEAEDGVILKTIGDAFMIRFDDPGKAVRCAIALQREGHHAPVKVGRNDLRVRIGIAHGEMFEKTVIVQRLPMVDLFGDSVNTASRLESTVSEVGHFALAVLSRDGEPYVREILRDECSVSVVDYTSDCRSDHRRSARLLTDTHRYRCEPVSALKGVGAVVAYRCRIKNIK